GQGRARRDGAGDRRATAPGRVAARHSRHGGRKLDPDARRRQVPALGSRRSPVRRPRSMLGPTMRFDPFAPGALDDPYPQYALLRAEDPVHWSEKLKSWVLTRYDDVCTALRDDAGFTADRSRASRAAPRSSDAVPPALRTVSSDPPACLPVRAILNAAL